MLEKMEVQNQLNSLKSQINPHFLFNALNNLYAIVQLKPEKASNDFMRVTINSTFGLGGIFDLATPLKIEKNHSCISCWIVGCCHKVDF